MIRAICVKPVNTSPVYNVVGNDCSQRNAMFDRLYLDLAKTLV